MLTSLEAGDRRRDLDAASKKIRETGKGEKEKESQQGSAGVDAGFASQGHGAGHGMLGDDGEPVAIASRGSQVAVERRGVEGTWLRITPWPLGGFRLGAGGLGRAHCRETMLLELARPSAVAILRMPCRRPADAL